MDISSLCISCFCEKGELPRCKSCGFSQATVRKQDALPARVLLNNRYYVGIVLSFDRSLACYKAWDTVTEKAVEIKEFFPRELVKREENGTALIPFSDEQGENFRGKVAAKQASARLLQQFPDSDNILHFYNSFTANNTVYLVCEYLEGMLLSDYLENCGGSVDIDTALTVGLCMLNGLFQLHKENMIHRAVNPQNIFITADDRIKLINLGSARNTQPEEGKRFTLFFTPGYAAPEQYRTQGEQGIYTDIYAAGAVLYLLLTGEKPVGALERTAEDTLLAPSALNGDIPKSISDAVMHAMALNPADRFQSAEDFRNALCLGNNSHAVSAAKKSGFSRAHRSLLNMIRE